MFGPLTGADPTRVPVPVTGVFPQIDLSKLPPHVRMQMALDPRLRQMLTMRGAPPMQQTPLGLVPGLLDTRNADPRPVGSLLEPAADILQFNRRGLLNPTTEMGPRGGRAAGGPGGTVMQMPGARTPIERLPRPGQPGYQQLSNEQKFEIAKMDAIASGPKLSPKEAMAKYEASLPGRPKITEQQAYQKPARPTAQELSEIKKQARAKSEAYKAGRKPGELDPAAFGKYADKVNPTQQSALIDQQLAGNARSLSEISSKQAAQAFRNKWAAWGTRNGWDANTSWSRAQDIMQAMPGASDSTIKFYLLLGKQKGLW